MATIHKVADDRQTDRAIGKRADYAAGISGLIMNILCDIEMCVRFSYRKSIERVIDVVSESSQFGCISVFGEGILKEAAQHVGQVGRNWVNISVWTARETHEKIKSNSRWQQYQ